MLFIMIGSLLPLPCHKGPWEMRKVHMAYIYVYVWACHLVEFFLLAHCRLVAFFSHNLSSFVCWTTIGKHDQFNRIISTVLFTFLHSSTIAILCLGGIRSTLTFHSLINSDVVPLFASPGHNISPQSKWKCVCLLFPPLLFNALELEARSSIRCQCLWPVRILLFDLDSTPL